MDTKDRNRFFEIIAILLTATGKFIFLNGLEWRLGFISVVCLFWAGYIVYRYKKDNQILSYWGLTTNGFKSTFLQLLPLVVGCIIVFIIVGHRMEANVLNWTVIPIMLLYPIWGILQQFLVLSLFGKNLDELHAWKIPRNVVILVTAILFSIVHYPFPILMVGTFLLAIVYTILFFRGKNLLVLGIYHGWLAAFFFYTVLGRNSWGEVFGSFF